MIEKIDKILEDFNSLKPKEQNDLLLKLLSINNTTSSLEVIQETVCNYYNILPKQIKSKTRKQEVVLARHVIMYLARMHTKHTLSTIGRFCGGRDHAIVLHACKKINRIMEFDEDFKKDINIISINLKIKDDKE